MLPSLNQRHLVPELMDDPNLDPTEHRRALAGLRRVNFFSNTVNYLATSISEIIAQHPDQSEWNILDLGCGSGDLLCQLALRIRREGMRWTGWDNSPTAIDQCHHSRHARVGLLRSNVREPSVNFECINALDPLVLSTRACSFDIVFCTLFLHHFDEMQSVSILRAMASLSSKAIIIDDLNRTKLGWVLAKAGCHLLSRSRIVHFDGPQSVRAAYTLPELKSIAEKAGLTPFQMTKHWPERFQFLWKREH